MGSFHLAREEAEGCELRGAGGGRVVGGGAFDTSTSSLRQAQDRQYRQAQDKFFVFSLIIATTLY